MKLPKPAYIKLEILTKIIGLALVAIGMDNVFKGNYFVALSFFIAGGLISIIPLFIEVEN
jgi:uncharacterized membrane protein YjjP (DUF1212 family)